LLLAVLAALSLWVLGVDILGSRCARLVWTGSETVYVADGMQSLTWIQGMLHHGASPDMYVLGRTPATSSSRCSRSRLRSRRSASRHTWCC